MLMGKNRCLLLIILIIVILSGCSNKKSAVEEMYDVLETVVSKEKVFEQQQEPLVALEKEEKDLYDKILSLGMKEQDQIVKLADKAIASTAKREEHMEKETESLKESEKEFLKVKDIKNRLEDPEVKKAANELYETMMQRYKAHDVLYKDYSEAVKNDKKLYEMFKNKDIALEDLETQVKDLNESYQKVFSANENFNKFTEQYNEKKLTFYKKSGLKSEN